ncbi:MAG: F0F1 ATP synthase subunit B [Bacteroidales bacterium]|nr:F0F1 ATP synthase subunit B [Bacteroidales bacterium]
MNNPLVSPGLGVIVWMLVAFGILALILIKWGWPVILKALDDREKTINESLNAAEKVKEEMKLLQAHNEDLLKQAKIERDEILRNARMTSEQIIEDARQKATVEADRIVENARENINYEKLKAMHELKNQIATLSIDIAEKLIKSELADKEKADAFISKELENAHLN